MLYERLREFLAPIKKAYHSISEQEVKKILDEGAKVANEMASKKIKDVYFKVGYLISNS